MAEQKPADTRINGAANDAAINDAAIKGMTPAIETIEAFAREIALMAWQALVRANQHTEKLRKELEHVGIEKVEQLFRDMLYRDML